MSDLLIALSTEDAQAIQAAITDLSLNGWTETPEEDRAALRRLLVLLVEAQANP